MKAKIIAISNNKGGVSKTTTTINLGSALARMGKKVLLVDNDPQGDLCTALGFVPEQLKTTLATLMYWCIDEFEFPDAAKYLLHVCGLDVLPANKKLEVVEVRLSVERNESKSIKSEMTLRTVLEAFQGEYDFILIDCGRSLGQLTINAYVAANSVIIPVEAHFLAMEALNKTLDTIRLVQKQLNPSLVVECILLTMYQERTRLCRSVREEVNKSYGCTFPVFPDMVAHSIKIAEQAVYSKPIFECGADEKIIAPYIALAKEVSRHGETIAFR